MGMNYCRCIFAIHPCSLDTFVWADREGWRARGQELSSRRTWTVNLLKISDRRKICMINANVCSVFLSGGDQCRAGSSCDVR